MRELMQAMAHAAAEAHHDDYLGLSETLNMLMPLSATRRYARHGGHFA